MQDLSGPLVANREARRALLISIFGTAIVFFGRFGYDVGTGDQDEFLPLLVHLMDSHILENDWFVSSQMDRFSIRLPLVLVLRPLASILGPAAAVFLVYAAAFIAAVAAVHQLCRKWFHSDATAVMATITGLALTKAWTLGGNDVLTTMLVPSMLAWAIALWGLYGVSNEKPLLAGLMCGLAILFQPLVGLHMTLVCSFIRAVQWFASPARQRPLMRVGTLALIPAIAGLTGAVVLIPLIAGQIQTPLSGYAVNIYTEIRAPHHFLPASFNSTSVFRFYVLSVLGLSSLFLFRSRLPWTARISVLSTVFMIVVVISFAYVNVSVLHIDTFTKLQLFKFSVTIKLILVMAIAAALTQYLLTDSLVRAFQSAIHHPWSWRISGLAFTGLLIASYTIGPLTRRNLPSVAHSSSPTAELYSWIREQTPLDAVFAIPSDLSGFRFNARRAEFISFKAFPYNETDIREWYRRISAQGSLRMPMTDSSASVLPELGGTVWLMNLVDEFEFAADEQVYQFARMEDIQYVLRRHELVMSGESQMLAEVYQNSDWHLYRVLVPDTN